jgi:hypothetical protein
LSSIFFNCYLCKNILIYRSTSKRGLNNDILHSETADLFLSDRFDFGDIKKKHYSRRDSRIGTAGFIYSDYMDVLRNKGYSQYSGFFAGCILAGSSLSVIFFTLSDNA